MGTPAYFGSTRLKGSLKTMPHGRFVGFPWQQPEEKHPSLPTASPIKKAAPRMSRVFSTGIRFLRIYHMLTPRERSTPP